MISSDPTRSDPIPDPVPSPEVLDQLSASDLIVRTLTDARALARAELELARRELRDEMRSAARAGIELAIAYACGVLALACLLSLAIAHGGDGIAILLAVVFAAVAVVVGAVGVKALPRPVLAHTRDRLEHDLDRIKEHVA